MKLKSIYIFLFLGTVSLSCEDFLDINDNPNSSVNADANLLFTGATVEHTNIRTQYLQMFGNYYTQHITSGNTAALITQWESYANPATILNIWTNNTWLSFGTAESLLLAEQTALELGADNSAAQAKILKAQIFLDLVQIYERMPYTQALTVGIQSPEFDDQEVILNGIVADLDDAIALIDASQGGAATSGDLLYAGNMTRWEKYANSMKLKTLMLLDNGGADVADEVAAVISGGNLFESNADDARVTFGNEAGQENPGWGFWDQYGPLNFTIEDTDRTAFDGYLTDVFEDVLNDYPILDPRIGLFFDLPDGETEYNSIAVGDDETTATCYIDENIFSNVYPDYFLTYSDVQLLVAEAILKGLATGDAQDAYESGVRASLERYNGVATLRTITPAQIDAYLGVLANLSSPVSTDNATTALDHVYVQQYIDSFARGLDGWTAWRKSKVPALAPHPNATTGVVIKRWPYDNDEPNINVNFPASIAAIGDPMWFEGN